MKSRAEVLAEEVKAEERRDDLKPVRVIIDPQQSLAAVQREILEEMASALGRAERRVTDAIARLSELDPKSEAWEEQRQTALRLRRDLSIHRDALRFPADPTFYETYPIPPRTS